MDFIYRLPLIQFDPKNPQEIDANWEFIKEAIKLSSPSLFQKIESSRYQDLTSSIQSKILKYLIRGRYRATPFGKWSGVGTGSFAAKTEFQFQPKIYSKALFSTREFNHQTKPKFGLAPGIKLTKNKFQYWAFSPSDQKWSYHILSRNPILNQLVNEFEQVGEITKCWFDSKLSQISSGDRDLIWNKLISTGLLQLGNKNSFKSTEQDHLNTYLENSIFLDQQILDTLEEFLEEAGALFLPYQRPELQDFIQLFHEHYDDRWVNLDELLQNNRLMLSILENEYMGSKGKESPLLEGIFGEEEILLDQLFVKKRIPKEIYDIQFLFRLGRGNRIFIENMVCNRPFVYSGRFSEFEPINTLQREKLSQVRKSNQVLFCDVELIEGPTINFITRHINSFDYRLKPEYPGKDKFALSLSNIYLGISDGEVILLDPKREKRIIPVFQHPLNGNQISHPLIRLLWHISHQNAYRFFSYAPEAFSTCGQIPRLRWKNLILQERKWVIRKEDFPDQKTLLLFFEKSKIPSPILLAIHDQELVLNWKNMVEMGLLWDELKRKKNLNLFLPSFLDENQFENKLSTSLFPQFVIQLKPNPMEFKIPQAVNLKRGKGVRDCLYFRVSVSPNDLYPVLKTFLPQFIQGIKRILPTLRWYFLIYSPPKYEIRLRFLNLNSKQQKKIHCEFSEQIFTYDPALKFFRDQYFREWEKFGNDGIELSETLFHLESEYCLFAESKSIYCTSEDYRVMLVANLWVELLLELATSKDVYDRLAQSWKQLDRETQKSIRREYDPKLIEDPYLSPLDHYKNTLLEGISHQNQFLNDDTWRHHIHLMVNRFFPNSALNREDEVLYLIYRKLGKRLFSKNN